ncbi:hypothetical protein A2313_04110 [Candidatus Roizmanbacteria bacterium RIFOXYB2_FULL_41_10]|uniref:UPF0102 protein A2209_01160 n=1 Tax=Candidatus Roizmanbacteria bacterium RIFOXYA1_FULL_41_12 TaxID=1802082 RepID=A0A1F7KFF2_9BACT|nr:MAG: hypothetical protein A2377_03480 [Candidatus Roizmanbacteria bacterium RIFOXYB1_FULL_41_27]OGK66584.1 MAG: hypothetical protein A2209_01160 [Candidatus Roizmanbacteria bacterium RIFOXYA1_FULL_41_12]OGK66953.1 MAG: hypothetical protein A2262_01115 [Candidatus Roizmanbacteria bacterium RIFOXYA2_FULL_41_8]OGK71795.1 MAG: hypothetical protein A2313_04110 [Candidatus Roizmanbacteria bacterium RIFOXYB2_FULL_41_10]OGK72476.1 MAG: hypothetical protein A2403_04010 [Candidatus Roizmanbacteria bac
MKKFNKIIGNLGEDLAAQYLQKQGYEILERNWGSKWGEIDIVCKSNRESNRRGLSISTAAVGSLVFVEVKTKTGRLYGSPAQMVNPRKLFQIKRIASLYPAGINQFKRIDVVAIVLSYDRRLISLNHYQAVY